MPTYETPKPISVTIDLPVGDIRIAASDRNDTIVDVRPSDRTQDADVRAAQQTIVEYTGGRLMIKAPKTRTLGLFGKAGSIDITIDLPTGSDLHAAAALATIRSSGRLGECRIKSTGDLHLDDTGDLDLDTGAGHITVNHITGDSMVKTGTGRVRLRSIDGSATIKNANGDNWIGEMRGTLAVKSANGDLTIDRAHGDLSAATANGDIRVGEVARGSVSLKTAYGQIDIGIRRGTAARLDVHTSYGRVHNQLNTVDSPEPTDLTMTLRAHTSYGDIMIRRCEAAAATTSDKELK